MRVVRQGASAKDRNAPGEVVEGVAFCTGEILTEVTWGFKLRGSQGHTLDDLFNFPNS